MHLPSKRERISKDSRKELDDGVEVLFYDSPSDFAVKLETEGEDEVYLYKTSTTKTFNYIYDDMLKKQEAYQGSKKFGEEDELKVPNLNFFEEKIFGGAVPKAYFPAVEKGLVEATKHGILAQYPVLGIKATLIDGSYHSVDSSEMAFKTATIMCFKEAMEKAKPALLEPFMTLHVYIDEQFTGDIMGHFNKKRARVMGSEILEDGLIKITAEAPQEEVMNYAVDLRAMTQGQGFFDMEFLGYEFAPEHVAKRVIANHQQ